MKKSLYMKESASFHCVSLNDHEELVPTNSLSVCLFVHDQREQQYISICIIRDEVLDVEKTEILYC
jgi:hypothetical protein